MVIRFIILLLLMISQSAFAYKWQNVDGGVLYICGDNSVSKLVMSDHSDVKSVVFQQNGNKLPSSAYSISNIYAGMTLDAVITLKNGSVVTEVIAIKDEPKWSLRIDEGKSQLCNGNEASLKAVVRQGTRKIPALFSWQKDGEEVSTDENFTSLVAGKYSLTATAFGCTKTMEASIIPSPSPSISGNEGLCLGESLTLTASDMDSYVWQGGETSNSATFSTSGDYYVVGTKKIGKQVCHDTLHFTIQPKMSANIEFGGVTAFCPGTVETEISADHDLKESEVVSYEWSKSGIVFSNDKKIVINQEGRYRVSVKTLDGCKSSGEVVISTIDSVADVVIPNLVDRICSGHQTTFSAEGQDLTYFEWEGSGISFGTGESQYALSKAGDYCVVGYTTNGCQSKKLFFHIDEIQSPSIFLNSVIPCEGNVETISCTVTAGSEFSWISPDSISGIASKSISISHSGQYRAQVKDPVTGCVSEAYADVQFLPYPEISLIGELSFCKNEGSELQVEVENRMETKYNYSWFDSKGKTIDTDSIAVVKKSGDYQVVVSNSHNCETRKTFSVTVNSVPKLKGDTLRYLCENSSVTLTMNGADHYQWSKLGKKLGSDSNKYKASSSGTFQVIGTNANGCSDTAKVKVELATKPVIKDIVSPACGATEGMLTLQTEKKCFFKWQDGSTDSTFRFSAAGEYSVAVTDSVSGCRTNHKVESVVRTIPTGSILTTSLEACEGDSIALEASFAAQDGGVRYSWNCTDDTFPTITINQNSLKSVRRDTSRRYGIAVTAIDSLGCAATDSVNVVFYELPQFEINSATVICKDSTAMMVAQSGEMLSYIWNTGYAGDSITVAEAGTYTCTATDMNGCVSSKSNNILLNSPIIRITGKSEVCMDSLSYLLINGDFQQSYWDNTAVDAPFHYAHAGLVTVVGIDSFGCKSYAEMMITERKRPTLSAPDTVLFCERESVDVDFWSNEVVRYEWDGKMRMEDFVTTDIEGEHFVIGYDSAGCPSEKVSVFAEMIPLPKLSIDGKNYLCGVNDSTVLAVDATFCTRLHWNTGDVAKQIEVYRPGRYTVVGYNGGCVSDTAFFDVTRMSLPKLEFTDGKTKSFCAGDSIELEVKSSDDVTIKWNHNIFDNNILINAEGFYVVEATDSFGCTTVDSVYAKESPTPFLSISGDSVVCENEKIELVANGSESKRIVWSDGSVSKTLTVDYDGEFWAVGYDDMGCRSDTAFHSVNKCNNIKIPDSVAIELPEEISNELSFEGKLEFCEGDSTELRAYASSASVIIWSNGDTGMKSVYAESGNHYVVATSPNGISDTIWFKTIAHPNPTLTIIGNTQICEGDSVKLTAITDAAYTQWSNGKIEFCTVFNKGIYSVVARSSFGCETIDSIEVRGHTLPRIAITGSDTLRRGESAILTATGGLTYCWGTGESTVPSIEITEGGRYKVVGTDSVGCRNVAYKDVVEIDVPVPLINNTDANEISICEGDSVLFIASGGDYYIWDNGIESPSIYAKESRIYRVSVCLKNGECRDASSNVRVLPNPQIEVIGKTQVCEGEVSKLSVIQRSGPKLVGYEWSSGNKDSVLYVCDADTVSVVAKDVNGCVSNRVEVTIKKHTAEDVLIEGDFDICEGSNDAATVMLMQSDVAGSFWIDGSNGDTLSKLLRCEFVKEGKYSVFMVDRNGCIGEKQFVIRQRSLPKVEVVGAEIPVCSKQFAKLTAISDPKCSFVWSTGELGAEITPNQSGVYSLVATNEYGCETEVLTELIFNDIPDMQTVGNYKVCPGESVVVGVTGADEYMWSDGSAGDDCVFTESGNGYVVGKDKYGCQKRIDFTIDELPVPTVVISAAPAKIKRGDSEVSFMLESEDDLSECTYIWLLSDGETSSQQSFSHTFDADDALSFSAVAVVETRDGCKLRLHTTIEPEFTIPNTFTPNGDMINDYFMRGFHVEIKDRHGIMLYQGDDGWNGVLPNGRITPDTYYYIVTDAIGQKHYGYVTVAI